MDATQARAAAIKQTRREILSNLSMMYHVAPFAFPALCNSLAHLDLPDEECVKRDLIYLVEKGYVRWTNETPMLRWSQRLYRLTARGSEIADRIGSDPALEP